MTVNDLLALLVMITALRVFHPDLRTGMRCPLRAGARVGTSDLLQSQPARAEAAEPPTTVVSRDAEA